MTSNAIIQAPVLLIGYNRPELLIKRINELICTSVQDIYISIDGKPSEENKEVIKYVKLLEKTANKNIVIQQQGERLGLAAHITSSITKVFKNYEHIIVLEDDIVISPNFYTNMINGFKIQKTTGIKGTVGGFSALSRYDKGFQLRKNKWRVTKYFSCWGWGCSSEVWADYELDLNRVSVKHDLLKSHTWQSLSSFQKNLWENRFKKIQSNPFFTWDIQFQFLSFKENFENLLPVFRFIDNEGFNDIRATHTKETKPRWMLSSKIDNSQILAPSIGWKSNIFEKLIDSNTIAGDTRILSYWNNIKKSVHVKS